MTEVAKAPAELVGICHRCQHFDRTPEGEGMRCKAFPQGIPIEIRIGKASHRKPYPNDHGIQFRERQTP